ncbi:MAG TPA: hypothetical protein DIV86_05600 [Alphaproteobacteria bacterium]|nr:hypothetical protein [Alphaproteobacteria bacterium]
MKQKHKRLVIFIGVFICVSLGTTFLLKSFEDNLIYFYSPTQIIELNDTAPKKALEVFQKRIRIGGMIEKNSVKSEKDGVYTFTLSDQKHEAYVSYKGLLPPMFREGQGVVAEGFFEGIEEDAVYFKATTLVTKHDENYMPPELSDMKK